MPATVRAIQALVDYAATLRRGPAAPAASSSIDAADVSATCLADLLTCHRLPPPKSAFAATSDDAGKARCGSRISGCGEDRLAQASHKTDVGGVALNLADADAVRVAATAMVERLARRVPGATLDGFLVQEMVAGVELIVGVLARIPSTGH